MDQIATAFRTCFRFVWIIPVLSAALGMMGYLYGNGPRIYEAQTRIIVRPRMIWQAEVLSGIHPGNQVHSVTDYAEIAKSTGFLREAASRLGMKEDDALAKLRSSISLKPIPATSVLEIRCRAGQPRLAAAIAETVAAVLQIWDRKPYDAGLAALQQAIRTELIRQIASLAKAGTPGERETMEESIDQLKRYETQLNLSALVAGGQGEIEIIEQAEPPRKALPSRALPIAAVFIVWGAILGAGLGYAIETRFGFGHRPADATAIDNRRR